MAHLDRPVSHVGDAEPHRGPALVDLKLLSRRRQYLAKRNARLGFAKDVQLRDWQERSLTKSKNKNNSNSNSNSKRGPLHNDKEIVQYIYIYT